MIVENAQKILTEAIENNEPYRIEELVKIEGDDIIKRAVCAPGGFYVSEYLAYSGTPNVLKIFINVFPQIINYGKSKDTTLFEMAISHQNTEVMAILLESYPYLLGRRNQSGESPLFFAISDKAYLSAECLLNFGTSLNASYINGIDVQEALAFCIKMKLENYVELLRKYGAICPWQSIHRATMDDDEDMVNRMLIHYPMLLNAKDGNGQTPLIVAARYCRKKVLSLLLNDYKPELNHSAGAEEITALGWAVINEDYDAIRKLDNLGAICPELDTKSFIQLRAKSAAARGSFNLLRAILCYQPDLLVNFPITENSPIIYAIASDVDAISNAVAFKLYIDELIEVGLLRALPALPNDIESCFDFREEYISLVIAFLLLSKKGILTEERIQPLIDHPRPLNLALAYCKLHNTDIATPQNIEAVQRSPRPYSLSVDLNNLRARHWLDAVAKNKLIDKMTTSRYSFFNFSINSDDVYLIQSERCESVIVDQSYYKKAFDAMRQEHSTFFSVINSRLCEGEQMHQSSSSLGICSG